MIALAEASPSLALIKYWGKQPDGVNLPATSSLAVTLDGLRTTTRVTAGRAGAPDDVVNVDGAKQPIVHFRPVIAAIRAHADRQRRRRPVLIESSNTFPTAAGLASSASGFAALTLALDAFFRTELRTEDLSGIARLGSGSAARSVFGGFTTWRAGATTATQVAGPAHWPNLRIIAVVVESGQKSVSSRKGMERSRRTSPYYQPWVDTSASLFQSALAALHDRNLDALGAAMRQSYLRMFGTMFTADPPLMYWRPETVAVIRTCEALRDGGVPVWETMDAGPQVKLITVADYLEPVVEAVRQVTPGVELIVSGPGGAPSVSVLDGEDL